MNEKNIKIESINPIDIYGVNDENLELLRRFFPKLKIIARGDNIKIVGEENDIIHFEDKIKIIIAHFDKYGNINSNDLLHIMDESHGYDFNTRESDVIVFGKNGIPVKARTANQRKMVEAFEKNDLVFAIGPAGTGKTYTAVALAVRALKNKEVKRIILTRPAVEAGENLGFLPGDLKEKLDPYLQPLYDALRDMIPHEKLTVYLEDGTIQIAPLAFMRGRTLDNACAILDEAQNATENQLKMFLTRMGKFSKFLVTGDITQIDLPKSQSSGLVQAVKLFKNIQEINFIFLDKHDIVRHKLVNSIVEAYSNQKR